MALNLESNFLSADTKRYRYDEIRGKRNYYSEHMREGIERKAVGLRNKEDKDSDVRIG